MPVHSDSVVRGKCITRFLYKNKLIPFSRNLSYLATVSFVKTTASRNGQPFLRRKAAVKRRVSVFGRQFIEVCIQTRPGRSCTKILTYSSSPFEQRVYVGCASSTDWSKRRSRVCRLISQNKRNTEKLRWNWRTRTLRLRRRWLYYYAEVGEIRRHL